MEKYLTKKLNIIEWLLKLQDEQILNKICFFLENNIDKWDDLTKKQQEEIGEAFDELDNGKGIKHQEVMAKFRR